jgi:hypothetical protein
LNDSKDNSRNAVVPPPPPRAAKRGILAAVPEITEAAAPDNMQKANSGIQDMNFKVDPGFHQAFKVAAAVKGMAMKDLLEASFRCWVEQYGDAALKALLPPKG